MITFTGGKPIGSLISLFWVMGETHIEERRKKKKEERSKDKKKEEEKQRKRKEERRDKKEERRKKKKKEIFSFTGLFRCFLSYVFFFIEMSYE